MKELSQKEIQTIHKPGIYRMRNDAYHAGPGVSSSELKELLKSGVHYLAYKNSEDEPKSKALRGGSLVHALILEDDIENEIAVGDFNVRRGAAFEKCVEQNPGKIVVCQKELDEAQVLFAAFQAECEKNPLLKRLLVGINEHAFYWTDPKTGILCKCKPDILTPSGVIVDIKTSYEAGFDAFQKTIVDMKYFLSAGHYLRGVKETVAQIGGSPLVPKIPTHFAFIVIENKEPFAVATYYLDATAIRIGEEMSDLALQTYNEGVSSGDWKGYPRKMIEIGLPNWALYRMNNHLVGRDDK